MKKHTPIFGVIVHRVVLHFLLSECISQLKMLSAEPSFEEDMIEALQKENAQWLPEAVVDGLERSRWWRHIKFAIEFAGLNHVSVAQLMGGEEPEFNPEAFQRAMASSHDIF